ncbi:serine phosphatase RsbU (regulator of sigma subunit) [Sediminihabitans luteus]|uniref:Serine phosphatase RsbU (Regulator of sigma subunit) n=1 Tax=Sediminihabitans luteus TaxID=1138585 RepID=A0A2M9CEY2_9CELL|nr:fused response regulator/phosphatase [Sediminihabitans luteus]PJJ70453.1 serine phosphatase RsbU (regulator of sigma subunit) [Sediminihabitans luteus]GII97926.1 hypothetical protein Slu03_03040 [Sediminihabitans luteus]
MTGTRTVLVVDDTDAHRYVMCAWLRAAGFDVLEASTGTAAIELAVATIDVVVLDINLPDVPGPAVRDAIKRDPATAHVPVLHVSATAIDAAARTAGLEGGADAYLPEPLDREEFVATVRALCRTHDAQRGAGRTARRFEALTASLVPLHEARTPEEVVDRAARGAATVLGTAVVAMVVVDHQTVLRTVCAHADGPLVRGRGTTPVPPPGSPSATDATGPTSAVFAASELPAPWRPLLAEAGVADGAWWTVWLRDGDGTLLGGLGVRLDAAGCTPTPEERDAVERFTDATVVALANLRTFAEEQRLARALQRTFLPDGLTVRGAVEVSARYAASDERLDVGGDFYDAFDLPDGRVAVVIGDVQGHSLRAASVMAEVRLYLRAYLREGHATGRALDLVNESLREDHPELVTACVCVLDPETGRAEISDAGHLPALLVRADGGVTVAKAPGRLLGLPRPDERSVHEDVLGEHDALVLVTDGLVERRDRSLREGLDLLMDVARGVATLTPDEACAYLIGAFEDAGVEDDVAVVVARRTTSR